MMVCVAPGCDLGVGKDAGNTASSSLTGEAEVDYRTLHSTTLANESRGVGRSLSLGGISAKLRE